VDEKSQIQALDRTAPILPLQPGLAERRSHDYVRHGTSTLFAALEIATGQVIAACKRRHRHQEFLAFLKQVTRAYRSASCTWSWTTTPPTSTPRSASGSRRVGHAMEYFNERYAALTTELQEVLDGIRLSEDEPDQRLLTRLWAENNDARRYVVLGDPAVRLCRPPAGDGGA